MKLTAQCRQQQSHCTAKRQKYIAETTVWVSKTVFDMFARCAHIISALR